MSKSYHETRDEMSAHFAAAWVVILGMKQDPDRDTYVDIMTEANRRGLLQADMMLQGRIAR